MHPGIPMADDGFQGFPLTAPTTSWLDVVENDS
jgi:hypothetical protein